MVEVLCGFLLRGEVGGRYDDPEYEKPAGRRVVTDSGHNPRVKELCAYVYAKVEVLRER